MSGREWHLAVSAKAAHRCAWQVPPLRRQALDRLVNTHANHRRTHFHFGNQSGAVGDGGSSYKNRFQPPGLQGCPRRHRRPSESSSARSHEASAAVFATQRTGESTAAGRTPVRRLWHAVCSRSWKAVDRTGLLQQTVPGKGRWGNRSCVYGVSGRDSAGEIERGRSYLLVRSSLRRAKVVFRHATPLSDLRREDACTVTTA